MGARKVKVRDREEEETERGVVEGGGWSVSMIDRVLLVSEIERE